MTFPADTALEWNEPKLGASPAVTVKVPKVTALRHLLNPSLDGLGYAYIEGEIDVEGRVPPHLRLVVAALDDTEMIRGLVEREAMLLERLAEDMRRYATKHDAIRRVLASDEEIDAGRRALSVLAGLRNVNLTLRP